MKGFKIRRIVVEGFIWKSGVGEGIGTKERGITGREVKEIEVLGIKG